MAVLPTQPIARPGGPANYTAVSAGGDKLSPGDHVFAHVKNGNAGACTVTIVTPVTESGFAVADLSLTVPAGTDAFIGPLPASLFRDTDGYASLSCSVTASVTVAILTA
ncbi:MAG: hypothetical protein ACXVW0_07580 [Nocardioides sp.]